MKLERQLRAWIKWRQFLHLRAFSQFEACRFSPRPLLSRRLNCSCSASQTRNHRRLKSTQATQGEIVSTKDPPIPASDHRDLGTTQRLFINSPYSPGSPIFLPHGTKIINKLTEFLRTQYVEYGFNEVITPTIYKKSLWETSGHWENYKDAMYQVTGRGASGKDDGEIGEDEMYGLKPMNCPGHCLIFKSQRHSFRDLPIRYADFGALHRNETSGSLSGLTRVRRFHQDDGHIFCRPDQIMQEIANTLDFVKMSMRTFHFDRYKLVLSTRPKNDYIGTVAEWDEAESQLKSALDQSRQSWELSPGDGAFYGPKIDIILRDSDGKEHQTATIQLDFQLPRRFGLEYVAEGHQNALDNVPKSTPVLIHRAIFGSLERFFALLTEHYNGRWPFWLSPRKCIILTVNQDKDVLSFAQGIQKLESVGLKAVGDINPLRSYVDVDYSSKPVGSKIKTAKEKNYNLIVTIGTQNVETKTVDVNFEMQQQWTINGKPIEVMLREVFCSSTNDGESRRLDLRKFRIPSQEFGKLLESLDSPNP